MIALLRSITVATTMAFASFGLLALAFVAPAAAQNQQLPPQVQLTPELVEGFIASYPELHQLGEQLKQKYGQVDADPEDAEREFRQRVLLVVDDEHAQRICHRWRFRGSGRSAYRRVRCVS